MDGHQRLRAAGEVGLVEVPVRVLQVADELEYMLRAVLLRRDLSPSQRAVLALDLEEYVQAREQARLRQRANLRNSGSVEVARLPPRGRSRDIAARLVNAGGRTVQKAVSVRAADPALLEEVRAGTKSVTKALHELEQARAHAAIGEAPPLPEGPFEVLLADPPWRMNGGGPDTHYPTQNTPEIEALQPPAAENAVLYLWSVASMLEDALSVIRAWGFKCVDQHVWVKTNGIGPGHWNRHRHELILVGRRGSFPPPLPKLRVDSVIEAPRRRHSQKPDEVYEQLERMYPGRSKLELYARTTRPGWASWGNEANAAA